jgi:choline kinase
LDRIEELLWIVVHKEERIMATLSDLQADVAALQSHTTDLSNALKSAMTVMDDLSTQLKVVIAANDPVALQTLHDQLTAVVAQQTADNTALLERVAADTPAAPAAPAAPTE